MPKIDQFRANPEFAGLSDDAIAKSIALDYPEVPLEKIYADLGVQPASAAPGRTLGSTAKDLGLGLMTGAVAVPETIVGLADMATGGAAGKAVEDAGIDLKGAHQYWQDQYSPELKAANQKVSEADGFTGKLAAAVQNPSVIADSVVQSLPAMALGGVAARGIMGVGARAMSAEAAAAGSMGPTAVPGALTRAVGSMEKAAGIAGAAGEGITMAGQDMEQIRQESPDGLVNPSQVMDATAIGAEGMGFAMLGATVARKLGIHDVQTMIAAGSTNPAARKGLVRSVLEGAFSEGVLEELPQSVVEQVLQNKASGKPLEEGVDQAAVMGLLAGAAMGGGANVVGGHEAHPVPADPADGPLSTAAVMASSTGNAAASVEASPKKLGEAVQALTDVGTEQPDRDKQRESVARQEAIAAGVVDQPVHPAQEDPSLSLGFSQPEPAAPANEPSARDAAIYEEMTGNRAMTVDYGNALDTQAHEAATSPTNARPEPSAAQAEAGNYKLGHVKLSGLDISIENPAGSVREDKANTPPQWSTQMQGHYGYIRRTEGADGDHVDAYIRKGTPEDYSGPVYVVDQVHQDGSAAFDEHKVMFGYANRAAAVNGYRQHYTPEWHMGRVTEMTMDGFKDWLKNGDTTKPASPKGVMKPAELRTTSGKPVETSSPAQMEISNAAATEQEAAAQAPSVGEQEQQGAGAAATPTAAPLEAAGLNTQENVNANASAAPAAQPAGGRAAAATGENLPAGGERPGAVGSLAGTDAAARDGGTAQAPAAAPAQPAGQRVDHASRWDAMGADERIALLSQTKAKNPAGTAGKAWADLSDGWHSTIQRLMKAAPAAENASKPATPDQAAPAEKAHRSMSAAEDELRTKGRDTHEIVRERRGLVVRPKAGQNAAVESRASASDSALNTSGDNPTEATTAQAVEIGQAEKPGAGNPETAPGAARARVSKNTIFTDDAAEKARAVLRAKLGVLNSGIDPELLQAGITLAGWHVEKGARSFAAFAKAMIADLGEHVRPYLKSWYSAIRYDPRASEFVKEMSSPAMVDEFKVEDIDSPAATTEAKAAPASRTLTDYLAAKIASNVMPKDNPALKRMVAEFDGKDPTPERMKQAQEHLEAAIVQTARGIASQKGSDREKFDALLEMYQEQPNLNVRTSTSVENQAYSTPAPLAFLASRLAGIDKNTKVLEPTAGTGMLLMQADPKNTTANELNPERAELLREQGFNPSEKDAATDRLRHAGYPVDAVIANPPFGGLHDDAGKTRKVDVDGYKIGQIDHLIAARALEAMKDDGRAVLILGANKVAGGLSTDDRIFFNWLYSHYKVASQFEVDGKLYTRQGAGWPVRVIAIDGRASSDAIAPAEGTIARADTWEKVYEQYEQALATSGQSDRGAAPGAGRADQQQAGPAPVPGSAGAAPASTGGRGSRGSASGNGDVSGGRARTVGAGREHEPGRVGPRAGAGRNDEPLAGSDRLESAGQREDHAADQPESGAGGAAALSDADNQFQTKYVPASSRKDEGVLIPVNMAQPLQEALATLEDKVGDIDQFAAKELGFKSVAEMHKALMGLQVDSVASAIHQIKDRGKAIIIADQTGIGKGRQAAALMRWAVNSGKTPVFFTVKPQLFTDMHVEDLRAVGADKMVKPFIMNVGERIVDHDGTTLYETTAGDRRRAIDAMQAGAMPQGHNAVYVTYSQINVENAQRGALTGIAPNAMFILDESHNAGGDSATGEFIKSLLDLGSGTVYLSATYAKRPDNMPLYFKTDMGEAVADDATLMDAMAAGGLPLQTVVSNNLVKAGQMFRRERSYDGINIRTTVDTARRAEHEKLADATTQALRGIVAADRYFHQVFFKKLQEQIRAEGGSAMDGAGNQAQRGVDHTEFSAVVHNFVRQMLLGLNAQNAADGAIASIKAGQKPVIALENTMGSFLSEYAANNGLVDGQPLGDFSYRTVLARALDRTRYYIEQDRRGMKVKHYVSLDELDHGTRAMYDAARSAIDDLDIDIPVSPIDWMRQQIVNAGHSVGEITGRTLAVDYSDPKNPKLSMVPKEEQTDKVGTTRRFNGFGTPLDALILNVAGSTGISLHASEKFKDQRQRKMIVAQPAQDINIFMQMLGRIHRTGQVALPDYEILNPDLPAVRRPTALLSKKMKSLNANTSSNTESATSVDAVDMLNKYGDQVVAQYLHDNPKLARDMGLGDAMDVDGKPAMADLARKATGRLALMPVATQMQFYEDVEQQYGALIDYLNKTNQNELEPRTFDFDAKELKTQKIFEGANPDSPFGQDAIYGEYSIKAQGKPMTPAEIRAEMAGNLGKLNPDAHAQALRAPLERGFEKFAQSLDDEEQKQQAQAVRTRGATFIEDHPIGATFRVDINGDAYNAVVTNLRSTYKEGRPGNPYSLSRMQVTIAVNGGLRHLTLPATQFEHVQVSSIARNYSIEQLFRETAQDRETAKIITGNLLGAYGELQGVRGTIISFTKEDGSSELGILLPKLFGVSDNVKGGYRLRSGEDALRFLHQSGAKGIDKLGIATRDNVLRVMPADDGGITVAVPKSKAKGGKYFLDKSIRAVTGDFVTVGDRMVANVPASKAAAALDALMKKQAIYALPSHAETAEAMFAPQVKFDQNGKPRIEDGTGKPMFKQGEGASLQADARRVGELQQHVDAITEKWSRAPEVVVLPSVASAAAPAEVRREARALIANGGSVPSGVWHGGRVYLFADRIESNDKATEVLFHEALGHMGLRGTFGPALEPILRQIATVRAAEVQNIIRRNGFSQADRLRAAEEFLAEMAQNRPEMGFVQRAIAAIKTALRRFGLMSADKMSDAEIIRNYILPARAFVEQGVKNVHTGAPGAPAFSQNGRGMRTVQVDGIRRPDSNSQGQPIVPPSQGMQGAMNFWRWFSDSKAVDDKGRPLVVYRGQVSDANPGPVAYFSADPDHTMGYAGTDTFFRAQEDGGNVIPAYVSLKNPLEMTNAEYWEKGIRKGEAAEKALIAAAKKAGHDGIIVRGFTDNRGPADMFITTSSEQIKSAIGNVGQFDPASSDIRFNQSPGTVNTPRDFWNSAMGALSEYHETPGKLNWWQKTFGTPYDLAQRHPETFGRVYNKVQEFLRDVSLYATEAADLAPRILPKLDSWKDAFKKPLSAEDTKALSAPLFEGTLQYARDRTTGQPILVKDLEERYAPLDIHKRASMLVGADAITPADLKRAQAMPIENFESYVNSRFDREFLSGGIVWTDDELKSRYGLSPEQIELYRDARKAIDKSLTNLALSDMVRYAGKDARPIADQVMAASSLEEGSNLLSDYLLSLEPTGTSASSQLTDTAAKVVEKAQHAQRLMDRGYAPLSRFGNYTVDVVDRDGERVYFGLFENRLEARRKAAEMRDLFPGATITRGTTSQHGHELFKGMTPETAELFGEMLGLESNGEGAGNEAFQKFLKEARANRSAMKRLIERKGIAGFSDDAGRVLASFIYSNARQTSNNLHMSQITEAANDIPQRQGEMKDAAIRLMRHVMEPQEQAVALKQLLFAQYLGGSVSAMLVNMTQPFAITAPYLTQWTSIGKVRGLMAGALRDVWKKTTGDDGLDEALKLAVERGIVAPQEVHQLMAQGAGKASLIASDGTVLGKAYAGAYNGFSRAAFLWSQPFAVAELFNRRTTFIAAYRLAEANGMADPAGFAEKAVNDTQFVMNKGNKPEWARGPVGSLLFTFKQYSISYLELVHRLYTQGGPQGKKAALYMLAMLMMMGGTGGLPFMDDITDLIDGIGQRLGYNLRTKRARQQFLENILGQQIGSLVDRGLTGLPGMPVDVASRFGMGNLIPGTGLLTEKKDHTKDVTELLGPGGDFASRLFQGANQALEGQPVEGALTAAPKAIGNWGKAIEMAQLGYYPDGRDRKVVDTDAGDVVAKFLGFQPNAVSQVQQAGADIQQMKDFAQLKQSEIADKLAMALFKHDPDATQSARDELAAWNRDNPESRIVVKPQSIRQRLMALRESKEQRLVKSAPKEMKAEVRRELQEVRR